MLWNAGGPLDIFSQFRESFVFFRVFELLLDCKTVNNLILKKFSNVSVYTVILNVRLIIFIPAQLLLCVAGYLSLLFGAVDDIV